MRCFSPLLFAPAADLIVDQPTIVATAEHGLHKPRDIKQHPRAAELWVANMDDHGATILRMQDTATVDTTMRLRDRAFYHYMANVSAIAFSADGRTLTTCQESRNTYNNSMRRNYFMGPTIYETCPCNGGYGRASEKMNSSCVPDASTCQAVGTINMEGDICDPSKETCWLIHSDMLHEGPLCMGAAHEDKAVTEGGVHVGSNMSDTVVWYNEGLNEQLMRFDFLSMHGPGSLDHRTANIRRYWDVKLTRREAVPGHMIIGSEAGEKNMLYISDTGAGRVLVVDPASGEFARLAQCVPDECYPSHDNYQGDCTDGYCTGGPCMYDDGYGCHHIFTETADAFEYELWNCTAMHVLTTAVPSPSGIAYAHGHVFVGDYDSGKIFVVSRETGATVQEYDTGLGQGLAGLHIVQGSDTSNLYFVNMLTNQAALVTFPNPVATPAAPTVTAPACNVAGDTSRPRFNVTHGAGYQNPMLIELAYGKDCTNLNATHYVRTDGEVQELVAGYQPGTHPADPNGEAWEDSKIMGCDMRTDCDRYTGPGAMNGDAILMAGFLCHPCIPNPCATGPCSDLLSTGKSGFSCPSDAGATSSTTAAAGNTTSAAGNTTTVASVTSSNSAAISAVAALSLMAVLGQ